MEAVAKDPEVMSGASVFRGTRVMAGSLQDYPEAGLTVEAFLDFPAVTHRRVLAVLAVARHPVEGGAPLGLGGVTDESGCEWAPKL